MDGNSGKLRNYETTVLNGPTAAAAVTNGGIRKNPNTWLKRVTINELVAPSHGVVLALSLAVIGRYREIAGCINDVNSTWVTSG